MKLARWIVMGLAVGACLSSAGCGGGGQPSVQETKVEARKEWQHTRAKMQYSLAVEQLKAGQLDQAQSKVTEALSLDPDYTDAKVLLAKLQIEQGQYAAAAAELSKLCTAETTAVEPVYLLAIAQERQGQLDDALANYRKAYSLDHNFLPAIQASAEVLAAQGHSAEGLAYIEGYLAQAADDPGMFEVAGRLAMNCRNYAKAVKYFQHAHDVDYKNPFYLESLAQAQYLTGQVADCEQSLRDVMAQYDQKDRQVPLWMNTILGQCCLAQNRPQQAREQFQRVIDQRPTDAEAWANLAKATLMTRDYARAAASACKALELKPDHGGAAAILGYSLILDDQAAKAIDPLKKACEVQPKDGTIRCLLGRAYALTGKNDQAIECYTTATQLEPENPVARELLAAATETK